MASLMERLKKNSKASGTEVLANSPFFDGNILLTTPVPMINVALSGDTQEGMAAGLLTIAGPSKHFKTMFALLLAKAWMDEHPEGVLMFYDSEFGSPQSYFESFGIDTNRVLHIPIANIEGLKFDLVNQLDEMDPKDEVMIIIDSIGNTASKKELDDALKESSKADMSRAKAIKGLFRMVTPTLTMKGIPLIAINHTYKEQGMFPKSIVSGGTGIYYSSNTIWIIGRRQNKSKVEGQSKLMGYDFVIRVEKSRNIKEGASIPITVSFDGGVEPYSGLLDVAIAGKYVAKTKIGNSKAYHGLNPATGEVIGEDTKEADCACAEFWEPILAQTDFRAFIRSIYKHGEKSMLQGELEIEIEGEEA